MKTQYIEVQEDVKLAYYRKKGGTPLIFLHGLGGSLENWIYSLDFFSSKGYDVIAVDLPGYGNSSKKRMPYSIAFYAEVIKNFIEKINLEEAPILVGNSMGAHIASYFAAKYKSRLKALIVVDGSGLNEMNYLEETFLRFAFDENRIAQVLHYMVDIFALSIFYDPSCEGAKEFISQQRKQFDRDDFKDYCFSLEKSAEAMIKQPMKDLLGEIKVETLVIWGTNDRLVPDLYAYEYGNLIPKSEIHKIERCGHIPQMENPDDFNKIVLNFILSSHLECFSEEKQKRKWLFFKK